MVGAILVDASNRNNGNRSDENDDKFNSGITLLCIGLAATVISVPTIVSGSVRVNKVKKVLNDRAGAGLNLSPGLVYNDYSRNLSSGITFRVRF